MWQLRDKNVERSRWPGTCEISPAVLLPLSLRCTKHKSWALFFAYRLFNLLCLLKLSLGWVQGAKSNPQIFCRARMASQVLRPSQLRGLCWATSLPSSWFSFSALNSPVHLLSPAFPVHLFAAKPFQSFLCQLWGKFPLSHLENARRWWLVMSWRFSGGFSEM